MSAAEPDRGAKRARFAERACLAALIVLAFVLRTRHIEDFYIGPDDGSYLHSAQVELLRHDGFHPLRWIGEDASWVRHLVAKFRIDDHDEYQHSYLHQWLARWLYRLGCGALQALRMSSALTGTLTVLVAWWVFARLWPQRRRLGLLAAAIVACVPFHVFYSRTGWGQVGFACFYLAYCVVLYRLLFVIDEDDRGGMRRAGWSLLAFSLLAFGWQEGVAPYIVGCAFVVAAAPWIQHRSGDERGWSASVLRSPRTWTWVWSSIPVGLLTIGMALFSPLAKENWFVAGFQGMSWWRLKQMTVENLVLGWRFDVWLGWLLIALGLVGFFAWRRENRGLLLFLCASSGVGALVLLVGFRDAFLLRVYMPVWLVVCLCAAVGLASCARWIGVRAGHLPASLIVIAAPTILLFTSCVTLFGRVESPFFVQRLYAQVDEGNIDKRNVDLAILERLRTDWRAGDSVGVLPEKSSIVRLLDIGIPSSEIDLGEMDPSLWPKWIVGRRNKMDPSAYVAANGGAYELVVGDTIGRYALYRRVK